MTLSSLTSGDYIFSENSLTSLPTGMTLSSLTSGDYMFSENTINTVDYSNLLVNIAANNANTNVIFSVGNSQYNATGETARNYLTGTLLWNITDGGLAA